MFLRSTTASTGATVYWLMFVCASLYPAFDDRTFAALPVVLLAWPWVDFLPRSDSGLLVVGCALLNTALIYVFIATVSLLRRHFRRIRRIV
jgi:hypothetical protein